MSKNQSTVTYMAQWDSPEKSYSVERHGHVHRKIKVYTPHHSEIQEEKRTYLVRKIPYLTPLVISRAHKFEYGNRRGVWVGAFREQAMTLQEWRHLKFLLTSEDICASLGATPIHPDQFLGVVPRIWLIENGGCQRLGVNV